MSTFADTYGPWAVVTGAGAGVGFAFTEELIERGVKVIMVDISGEVEHTADRFGENARTLVADVSDPGWMEAVDSATSNLEVGLAVANAGVSWTGRFLDMDARTRQRILDVNCRATADMASWALPAMIGRGRGGFVVTSSGSALAGTAGVGLYSATKAFGVNLVEAIGWEIRGSGVDTLAVVAPTMDTPAFRSSNADPGSMMMDATDPRTVVAGALDALGEGGRWLADEGLELAASVDRRERVDLMSKATTAMYPDTYKP